jgi:hypothetical protein
MRKYIFSILLAAIMLAPLPALAQLPTMVLHSTRYRQFANAAGYTGSTDVGRVEEGSHRHQFHTLSYSRRLFIDYLAVSGGWFYESSKFDGDKLFAEKVKTYQKYKNNGFCLGLSYALYDQYYQTSDMDSRRHMVRDGLGVSLFLKGYITNGYLTFDRNVKGYVTYDLRGKAARGGLFADYAFIKEVAVEGMLSAEIGQVDLRPRIKSEIEGQYQNAFYAVTPSVNVAYYPVDQIKIIAGFSTLVLSGGDTMTIDRPSTLERDMFRFYIGFTGFFERLISSYGNEEYQEPERPSVDDFEEEAEQDSEAEAPPETGPRPGASPEGDDEWGEAQPAFDAAPSGVAAPDADSPDAP